MASRDKSDLHIELVMAYNKAAEKYKTLYPNAPQPFLTCTYRSPEEQNELFKKVPQVTKAKGGQSPHNYNPSFAFDIGFIGNNKQMDWTPSLFKNFADLIGYESVNITWGGNFIGFSDMPHFELSGWKKLIVKK